MCIFKTVVLYSCLRGRMGTDQRPNRCKFNRPSVDSNNLWFTKVAHNYAGLLAARVFVGVPEVFLIPLRPGYSAYVFRRQHSTLVRSTSFRDGIHERYSQFTEDKILNRLAHIDSRNLHFDRRFFTEVC